MIKKLLDLNVDSNIVLWIQSFLTNRTQQVKLNSTISPFLSTNTGAPQGCVLSPVLYTIYTNDCRAIDTDNLIIKYADDTSIVGRMSSTEDSLKRYNSEINHFVNWCTENYLEINVNKTKELVIDFRKRGTPISEVTINGLPIERVSEYKYLVTVIDDKLKFDKNTYCTTSKLRQRLYFLRKLNSFGVDNTILELFYRTILQSVLSFSLICFYGNMLSRDKHSFLRVVKQARRITRTELQSPETLY